MKALCWEGVDEVAVRDVPDPQITDPLDLIVRVRKSVTCGSDLHLLGGQLPFMRRGDVLGHEFVGEVVEVGRDVHHHAPGDRVVASPFIACGRCWYCEHDLHSLCDNSNPNPGVTEQLWGFATAGCYGYSHAQGGFAGSHAEYLRVPFADVGAFTVPDQVSDDRALFAADAAATGWMGADLGGVKPGTVVAVWGAGAVGQLAARASVLLGADRVISIDRCDDRLELAAQYAGSHPLHFERVDVGAELLELTGGRGPDVCIEAVGMEATGTGPERVYDQVKQRLRLQTGRPAALREAIVNCRKGGRVVVLGVFAGLIDKFPIGAVMNKGLTVRGAQVHAQRYLPMLLQRMARDELKTEYLATHQLPLEHGALGYRMFKDKLDGCLRVAFTP